MRNFCANCESTVKAKEERRLEDYKVLGITVTILAHFYRCPKCKETFAPDAWDDENLRQAWMLRSLRMNNHRRFLRVIAPHFAVGIHVQGGLLVSVAPILKWAKGMHVEKFNIWCRRKGFDVQILL